jgi:RND superfamily putative drug exporter
MPERFRMFRYLGRLTATHPGKVCAVWLGLALALALVAPRWDSRTQDDDIRFLPARCDSVRGYQLLEKAFPQDVFASRAVLALERPDRALSETDLALADRCAEEVNRLRDAEPDLHIGRVNSHRDPFVGKRLLSADRQCVLIQVSLASPYLALQTRKAVDRIDEVLRPHLASAGDDAPRLLVTGPAGIGRDLISASAHSLDTTTGATVLLVLVVLLLVYRSPLLALVPLVTIALASWVALNLLAMLTLIPGVYLVHVSKVFAVVLLYGAGVDYCIFLISRYREEIGKDGDLPAALTRSVSAVGGALAASAGTVVCGLGMMGFAEFAKVRSAGPAIALSLVVVLAASLTLTPALLHLLGRRVFWPLRRIAETGPRRNGIWEWVSRQVVARPVVVWLVAAGLLLPLAVIGLRVTPNYKPTGELSPTSGSVQGMAAIQRHFTAGEVGPVTVLLSSPHDWSTPEGKRLIQHVSGVFGRLDNVAEVRSLTQPLGTYLEEAPPEPELAKPKGLIAALVSAARKGVAETRAHVGQAARDFYVGSVPADGSDSGRTANVTRLDVVLNSDPFSAQSTVTVDVIQTWLREHLPYASREVGDVRAECYGVTVNARDLALVTEADRSRVNWLVLAGVFLILIALVRSPGVALYLLATVLFSYYATLGATALTGWLALGRPLGEVDWRVPFFLFTILVAVGEDYNILLMTRAMKERKRRGADEGVRRALAHTGGAITSCGLIMAGTFATLMFGGLSTLVQIGFALAFGVLLDTFVVRPLLVPAFTLLVWRREEEWAGRRWSLLRLVPPEVLPPAWRRAA